MLLNETIKIQNSVAEYCKTGIEKDIPGVTPDRLHHYRRLIYNIVDDTMETAFPVTKQWLTQEEWDILISDFLNLHPAQTPQVWKLPFEFYLFAKQNNYASKFNKKALNDLLYFEWLEIEIHTMPDKELSEIKNTGNTYTDPLVLNPHSKLIRLEYPIHIQHADQASGNKGNWQILIYRDNKTDIVHFIQLSPLFAYVTELLKYKPLSVKKMSNGIIRTTDIINEKTLLTGLIPFIENMLNRTVILGFA